MTPKQEAEVLLNALLPFAERMLREHGEFYPYGGHMKPDGTIVELGVMDPDTEHPKSKEPIYVLRSSLQELARRKECRAAAIVFDVVVMLPGSNRESDAIKVCLDHAEDYSTEVFFPYERTASDVLYGETFAQRGKSEIFTT